MLRFCLKPGPHPAAAARRLAPSDIARNMAGEGALGYHEL